MRGLATQVVMAFAALISTTILTACGQQGATQQSTQNSPPVLNYAQNPAVYVVGTAITPNTVTPSSSAQSFSVSPSLPAGLSLDTTSGTITGTPTTASTTTGYAISGTNAYGSNYTTLAISVLSGIPVVTYPQNSYSFDNGIAIAPIVIANTGGAIQSCAITPALPTGISFNATNCQINGTPVGLSTSATYTITATNAAGSSAPTAISVQVVDELPNIQYSNSSYTFTKTVAISALTPGNTGGGITTCTASSLPAGLVISPTDCTITGTPTAISGSTPYTITATNSAGNSFETINITVTDAPPVITYTPATDSLSDNVAAPPFTPVSSGGTLTGCAISPATLPAGLSFSSPSCTISGTPTAASASTNYTVTATSAGGMTSKTITIVVNETAPTLSYAGTPFTFNQNVAIATANPTNTGGNISSCTVTPGLPTGLNLSSGCVITGTPTVAVAATNYQVTAHNSASSAVATINILVKSLPPIFNYPQSPYTLTKGQAITTILPNSTGTAIAICSSAPTLPAGLQLNSDCSISGTPTAIASSATYTITGTTSTTTTGTATIQITVNDVTPNISYAGSPYNFNLSSAITNQTPANTGGAITGCSISPALPTGLSLSTTTCVLSGTPSVLSASTAYTVTATNTGGPVSAAISIQVTNSAPNISYSPSTQTYHNGVAISAWSVTNTGGSISSCSVSPNLPGGLVFNTSTCQITGTPSGVSATANYTVTATNNGGSANATITIQVVDTLPVISYSTPFNFGINTAITAQTPTNTGGIINTCTSSPAIPAGLNLSNSCVLTGTPSVQQSATNYTITATNTAGSATTNISITVINVPNITYPGSPYIFTKGVSITPITPANSGSPATTCSAGTFPAGLLISSSCVISGTPTTLSTATFYTITNSDSAGSGANASINIAVVNAIPTLSYSPTSYTFSKGTAITAVTPTLGGGTPTSCTVAPALPATLSLNNLTCVISGTPTVFAASQVYTVTATNTGGSATATLTIQVNDAIPALTFAGSPFSWTRATSIGTITPTNTGGTPTSCTSTPTLPAGISLSNACVLTGTPTTFQTASTYSISASNTGGTASINISIGIPSVPSITYPGGPYIFTKGVPISTVTPANSGSPATTCTTSALPTGITLNSNCTITGTPTALSTATAYTIANSNSAGAGTSPSVTISVVDAAPTLSYSPSAYTFSRDVAITPVSATLGGGAVVSCTASPTLPGTLSLNATTCQITGTPNAFSASQAYTITATNTGGSATSTITLQINDSAPALTYSGSPYSWTINTAITTVTPTNSAGAVTSCNATPSLPAGLSISNTCVITGTPTVGQNAANYAINSSNTGGSSTTNISIAVIAAPVLTYPASPYIFGMNTLITPITPTNTGSPTTSCSGTLPAGLLLDAVTCQITGTPTAASGATNYNITGTNSAGSNIASLQITVVAVPAISYSPNSYSFILRESVANITVTSTGGAVSSCGISPALPSGLSLNTTTCAVTGTPSTTLASTNFTVTATNTAGSATATLNLVVNDQPEILFYGYTSINGSWNQSAESSQNAFRITQDGQSLIALTQNTSTGLDTVYPSFNPNTGASVVYSSLTNLTAGTWNASTAGSNNIWTANSTQGNYSALTTNVTAATTSDNPPVYSPDGTKIVFASKANVSGVASLSYNIFIMNADGSALTALTKSTSASGLDSVTPIFSPSGTTIYFSSLMNKSTTTALWTLGADPSSNLWSITTAGGSLKRITNSTTFGKNCTEPSISADGTTLAYTSNSGGSSNNIWFISSSATASTGTQLTKNTNASLDSHNPKFSPDGSTIVFQSLTNVSQPGVWNAAANGSYNVWSATNWAGAATFTALTTNTAAGLDSNTPSFMPDSSKIVFSSLMSVSGVTSQSYNIWIMNLDGTSQAPVTQNTNAGLDSYLAPENVVFVAP